MTTTSPRPAVSAGSRRATLAGAPRRGRGEGLVAHAFLSPWLLGFVALTAGPMLVSLYLSFTDYNLFTAPQWVGFDNFARMFSDGEYAQSVQLTLTYVLVGTPLKLGAALAIALLLNRVSRGSGFLRSAFYAPSLIGASVSIAIVWKGMFNTGGPVDGALRAVGIELGGWSGTPALVMPLMVLLAIWQFGAPMVIFLAGLKQLPRDLFEAAEVDGAGPFRRLVSITLPLLSPVIFFNLLLEVIGSFQIFASAFVISNGTGGPAGATNFYTVYLYRRGFTDLQMGYASAMAWVLLVAVGLIAWVLFRTSRRWVYYGGDAL